MGGYLWSFNLDLHNPYFGGEWKNSTWKLVFGIMNLISTSPEQQAGTRLHRIVWMALWLNANKHGPFFEEGEGRMNLQNGRKSPGLTQWWKDGCQYGEQADAGPAGKAAGCMTASWAAGVGERGDTLHLAARTSSRPWRAQLIGNKLQASHLLRACSKRGSPVLRQGSRAWEMLKGKGKNPATALLDTQDGLLEVTKAPCQGLCRTFCFSFYLSSFPLKGWW